MMNGEGGRQRKQQEKSFIQSKKRNLLQNAAQHTSDGSENEWATNVDIVSSEYLPVYEYEKHMMNDEWRKQKIIIWMMNDESMKAEEHIMSDEWWK